MSKLNFALLSYCQQRKKAMLFSNPPPRYNPVSPYNGTYTKDQLDMRRKAEILKYNNNTSSSKTNNLTKSQRWAQIANGNSNKQTTNYPSITITTIDYNRNFNNITIRYPNVLTTTPTNRYLKDSFGKLYLDPNAYQIVGNIGYFYISIGPSVASQQCIINELIPTPTSSSDVPGPIIYLYNDETIPLYNYSTNTNVYSKDTLQTAQPPWLFTSTSNIQLTNSINSTFLTLFITEQIDKASYSFSLQIPFSIYSTGTNLIIDPSNTDWHYPGLSTGLNFIEFGVNYNDIPVSFTNPPEINLTTSYTQMLTYNNGVYTSDLLSSSELLNYDVSFGVPPTDPIDSYNAQMYSGIISISNILLPTEPGYVYDFYIQINTNNVQIPASNKSRYNQCFQTSNSGIIANVSNNYTNSKNCVVYPISPSPSFQILTLTGF